MVSKTFPKPADDRYFEDYEQGDVYEFGPVTVDEESIIGFAREFDPQPFHIDKIAAQESLYGGIIASGWHVGSLMMRCMVDNYISEVAGQGSPGVENIRWPNPTRAGDILSLFVTVESARRSKSNPSRGIVVSHSKFVNQNSETTMEMTATGFLLCRDAVR